MNDFFTPEDFVNYGEEKWEKPCLIKPSEASDRANAKLEREGKVVYGGKFCLGGEWSFVSHNNVPPGTNTHQAILLDIKPIAKCEHTKKKIKLKYSIVESNMSADIHLEYFECECGAKVEPVEFTEIS